MSQFQVITNDFLNVFISSNITSFTSEKRFDKSLTVADLKSKLELITGATSGMKLTAFDKEDKLICELSDNNALLGSFPLDDGVRIHVEDNSKMKGEFENTANVDKFELTKEEYNKREDTVAAFLKKNKLGKYNEEEMADLAKQKQAKEDGEKCYIDCQGIIDGARCEITIQGQLPKRGTVRFVGKVHFQPGWWVGVEYDEPSGKNDGSVGGERYFTCQHKYGGFVKPGAVKVGDFPPEELFSDDEM